MKFSGPERKQAVDARKYVYACFATVIELDERWFIDGIENEPDLRRVNEAMKTVQAELFRKAKRL